MIEDISKPGEEGDKTLYVSGQHGCGVSQAWWPADMRRSLAISKTTAHRRSLTLHHVYIWQKRQRTALSPSLPAQLFSPLVTVGVAGILALTIMFLLHQYIIMIVTFLLCGIALFARSLISDVTYMFLLKLTLNSRKRKMRDTPDTPLPDAPLVRVLETIDLSSSGVEHFLDTSAETSSHVSTMGELTQ